MRTDRQLLAVGRIRSCSIPRYPTMVMSGAASNLPPQPRQTTVTLAVARAPTAARLTSPPPQQGHLAGVLADARSGPVLSVLMSVTAQLYRRTPTMASARRPLTPDHPGGLAIQVAGVRPAPHRSHGAA